MSSNGYDTKQYLLEILEQPELQYREITRLNTKELEEYKALLEKLKVVNGNRSNYDTSDKGKALENLVSFLIEKSCLFNVHRNVRTNTNEIDQLLKLNRKGQSFRMHGFLEFLRGDTFLSECKNYQGKIDVTWVGKFFSLLQTSSVKLGLLFSYNGLSGRGWSDGAGLVKKLFLLREDLERRTYILDFNIADFELIAEGRSLLELIDAKMNAIQLDTSFDHFITTHPAENEAGLES